MPRPDNEQMQQYRQQHQQVLHELQQRQAEQQVNQVMEAPQQVRQVQTDTPVYDGMFRHLAALPPDVPVAGGPVPRAEREGYKEKKRQKSIQICCNWNRIQNCVSSCTKKWCYCMKKVDGKIWQERYADRE